VRFSASVALHVADVELDLAAGALTIYWESFDLAC
jgi:hypothetical protein